MDGRKEPGDIGAWAYKLLLFIINHIIKSKTALLTAAVCFFICPAALAQVKWAQVDTLFGPLPASVQLYKTTDSLDGKPFIAYYLKAKLADKTLDFITDTTLGRRLTPLQFFEKNERPLVVVNGTFFSFESNKNLNVVVKDGKLVGYNIHTVTLRGKDTFQFKHPFGSALGINKQRRADIAWLYTDSLRKYPLASQTAISPLKDSAAIHDLSFYRQNLLQTNPVQKSVFKKWKMQTAIGGGPVLVQNGQISISNEAEMKFAGKAIQDKHPRTCMGYTAEGYLIIMVIQGRFPGVAEGATLEQQARLMISLGCVEALNLDGGGSSCLLVNGKETITPSDKTGERPVPAVFIIKQH